MNGVSLCLDNVSKYFLADNKKRTTLHLYAYNFQLIIFVVADILYTHNYLIKKMRYEIIFGSI